MLTDTKISFIHKYLDKLYSEAKVNNTDFYITGDKCDNRFLFSYNKSNNKFSFDTTEFDFLSKLFSLTEEECCEVLLSFYKTKLSDFI